MTISELEKWEKENGLQDLRPEIEYILEKYYEHTALFDDAVHEEAAKDLAQLIIGFWEELGEG